MKTTDKATCARCHGVNSDETRRHCAPCILKALMRWPSLKLWTQYADGNADYKDPFGRIVGKDGST